MSYLEALILGLLQGLTEFLPVSSSGHLEIGKTLLNIQAPNTLLFTISIHGGTVLSTLVIFWRDIFNLFKGMFSFKWNDETKYICLILISMIPVGIVGLFFKDIVEGFFEDKNISLIGLMEIITATLLAFTFFYKPKTKKLNFVNAFIIGISQAIAVLPGISRSGSTIATGLLLGVDKEKITRFSFLMVIIPILGENILDLLKGNYSQTGLSINPLVILVGFLTAFITGIFACKWMISIVKKGKLIYFAIYCFLIGIITISVGYHIFG